MLSSDLDLETDRLPMHRVCTIISSKLPMVRPAGVLLVYFFLLAALAQTGSAAMPRHPSLGRARDIPLQSLRANVEQPCIEPPPPILQQQASSSATRRMDGKAAAAAAIAGAPPPKHLKYLALDGNPPADDTKGWANLAFLGLDSAVSGNHTNKCTHVCAGVRDDACSFAALAIEYCCSTH